MNGGGGGNRMCSRNVVCFLEEELQGVGSANGEGAV